MAELLDPDPTEYGRVVGRFTDRLVDDADPLQKPQRVAYQGLNVLFTPEPDNEDDPPLEVFALTTATPPETFTIKPLLYTTDENGYVCAPLDEALGAEIPASTSLFISPTGWRWRVEVWKFDGDGRVIFPRVAKLFRLDPGAEVDITALVSVPPDPDLDLEFWELAVAQTMEARDQALEILSQVEAFGGTNEEIVSTLVTAQITNPETAANNAVVSVVVDTLDGFTLDEVPMLIDHGDNALLPRPETGRPVWWQGSVVPANRADGDSYFLIEEDPITDTVIAADDFNRADGPLGSTPIGAKAWTVIGSTAAAGVVSQRAAFTALGGGTGYAVFDSGSSDGRVQAVFATMSANHIGGVVVRYVDTLNQILLACRVSNTDFHYRLIKRVANTVTVLADFDVISTAGDVVQVDLSGPSLIVRINGVQKFSGSVPDFVSASKVGFYATSAEITTTYDDFSVVIPA